jgi:pimeloyl-ACP methyl ester carboxylesterase
MKLQLLFSLITVSCVAQATLTPLDKELTAVTYPFAVSYKTMQSQQEEMRMAYMDVPALNPNGKTIVLLHGKNFNGAYWEQTIKELNKKGYRVIAPDQIGFGKSTKPEHYQYSFSQLAANTKAILDQLHIEKAIILGHSMGGMLAARFALQYPETTEKLILENPIGLEDYKAFVPYKTVEQNYQAELRNTPESYKAYQLKNYYDNKWKPEYDRWLNFMAGWTLHKDYPLVAWNAALTTDMVITQPVVYEFKDIKCPTLLIIGTRDRTAIGKDAVPKEVQAKMGLYNELGKKTQQAIPNSKLVELENVGHLPHIEVFEKFFGAVVEFLDK